MTCICCEGKLRHLYVDDRIEVLRCQACATDYANHLSVGFNSDYDQIWQQHGDEYLVALHNTRTRQARLVYDVIKSLSNDFDGVIDIGAGRGWLLKALRSFGLKKVIGIDQSDIAINGLKEDGIEAFRVDQLSAIGSLPLSFSPKFIFLMDVIEHISPTNVKPDVSGVISAIKNLELLTIKVPRNNGFFYVLALLFARVGIRRFYHQLWQVGTTPPHEIYFSEKGFRKLASQFGEVKQFILDADVESSTLPSRMGLKAVPKFIQTPVGLILMALIKTFRLEDSQLAFIKILRK